MSVDRKYIRDLRKTLKSYKQSGRISGYTISHVGNCINVNLAQDGKAEGIVLNLGFAASEDEGEKKNDE